MNGSKESTSSGWPVKKSDEKEDIFRLQTVSNRYLDEIKNSESLLNEEIDEIKEKIANNFYFSPEITDIVIEKILGLPGFKELL